MSSSLLEHYTHLLTIGHLSPDEEQALVVQKLDTLLTIIRRKRTWYGFYWLRWQALFQYAPWPPKGLYLWGGVGRGKTCLMDLFFQALPGTKQQRLHYHHFMRYVHQHLQQYQGRQNPLRYVAQHFAHSADVLCFDEFFVTDITDAMLLGTLLRELLRCGIILVITSNTKPSDLYLNGLQRSQFLPAIELLQNHLTIVHLSTAQDYRLSTLLSANLTFHGSWDSQREYFIARFQQLTNQVPQQTALHILGRPLEAQGCSGDIIWFTLKTLCAGPRSPVDYIELARCYQTIFISEINKFTHDDWARRFINLIDELYDRRVKVILHFTVPLQDLYPSNNSLAESFKRTISRLIHMQSQEYLAQPHILG